MTTDSRPSPEGSRPGGDVEPTSRCRGRQGLRHSCGLAALHAGDHRSGERTWPRSPREQAAYERQLEELRALRDRAIGWQGRTRG